MTNVNGSQIASTTWVTVPAMIIDTFPNAEERITYFFQATTNDVVVQIQASINNLNWITINTRDLLNPDAQQQYITVVNGGSAVAVVSPEDNYGINSGFRYYRMQITGVAPYGTIDAVATAK